MWVLRRCVYIVWGAAEWLMEAGMFVCVGKKEEGREKKGRKEEGTGDN